MKDGLHSKKQAKRKPTPYQPKLTAAALIVQQIIHLLIIEALKQSKKQ